MNRQLVLGLSSSALLGLGLGLGLGVIAPATAADGPPVVVGEFTVLMSPARNTMPEGFEIKPGTRTYSFGSGCAVGASCTISRVTGDGETVKTKLVGGGGGFTWRAAEPLDCSDPATGALRTVHGADYTLVTRLTPTATAVRDGVTYVTAMKGTSTAKVAVNGKGRADNCTIPPRGTLVETQRATLTAAPVPLDAPTATELTTPLGIAPETTTVTGTLPAFELPQTDRQLASAAAVSEGRRSSVPGSLVTPTEAIGSLADRLPQTLLLVALIGLLMVFPAQVFNSTYDEHHDRIDRQLARLRPHRKPRGVLVPAQPGPDGLPPPAPAPAPMAPTRGRRLGVFAGCLVAGTMLGGLLDPNFGANTASYALTVGILLSILVAALVAVVGGWVFRSSTHRPRDWYLQAIPSALLITVVCVVISRVTGFQPGYLYGVLGGAVFAAAMDRRSDGKAEVTVTLTVLAVALGAWVAFEPVTRLADGSSVAFWLLSTDAFLAALFIGGIEGLLFGLIPLRFLPGYRVKDWTWFVWVPVMGMVLFTFVHVLLMPEAGYLGRSTTASVTLTLALFVAFGVGSGLFWLWFRLRPTPGEGHEPPQPGVDEPARRPATDDARVTPSRRSERRMRSRPWRSRPARRGLRPWVSCPGRPRTPDEPPGRTSVRTGRDGCAVARGLWRVTRLRRRSGRGLPRLEPGRRLRAVGEGRPGELSRRPPAGGRDELHLPARRLGIRGALPGASDRSPR